MAEEPNDENLLGEFPEEGALDQDEDLELPEGTLGEIVGGTQKIVYEPESDTQG